MKSKVKRAAAVALATVTCLSTMVGSALAATPTFQDVPETHWAYTQIERAATDGIVNGMSPGVFSPATQVTSAQFFAMVQRVCLPGGGWTTEGGPWYEQYWNMAEINNLLNGTGISDSNFTKAISRYDMAQALYNFSKIKRNSSNGDHNGLYGIKSASPSQIKDYNSIPEKYRTAVLWAYGAGALKGDEKGNFNGSKVMNRAEAATVMVRMEDIIKACDQAEDKAKLEATLEHSKTSLYDNYQKATYTDGRTYTKEYVEFLKWNAINGKRIEGNASFVTGTYEVPTTINFHAENPNRKLSHVRFTIYIMEPYQGYGIDRAWVPACEYVFDEGTNLKDNSGSFTFLIPAATFYSGEEEVKIAIEDCYDLTNGWTYGAFDIPFEYKMCIDPDNYLWSPTF